MNQVPTFSMTVGELAYAMRLDLNTVQIAARVSSSHTKLGVSQLDSTLDYLKQKLNFQPRGWDLSLLNNLRGKWVDSLQKLYSIPVAYPASLPPSQGMQIRELILRERPERVLEVGCFIGISSHWIASALEENKQGCLDSVDTFWPKYPLRFHFGYLADPFSLAVKTAHQSTIGKRVTFHKSDSVRFSRSLSHSRKYDFMFIDGDHTYEGVTRDFFAYFPYLRKGGAILLHDTNPKYCGWQGPRRLIDNLLKNQPSIVVEEIETEPNFGMALIRKLTDKNLELSMSQTISIRSQLIAYDLKNRVMGSTIAKLFIRYIAKPTATHLRRNR